MSIPALANIVFDYTGDDFVTMTPDNRVKNISQFINNFIAVLNSDSDARTSFPQYRKGTAMYYIPGLWTSKYYDKKENLITKLRGLLSTLTETTVLEAEESLVRLINQFRNVLRHDKDESARGYLSSLNRFLQYYVDIEITVAQLRRLISIATEEDKKSLTRG